MNLDVPSLSGTVWVLIGIVLAVQTLLLVIGFVVLVRTPTERVQFGRKWPWVLIMLCLNMIGPILFLVAGRRPAPVADAPVAASSHVASTVASTVASLYGARPGSSSAAPGATGASEASGATGASGSSDEAQR